MKITKPKLTAAERRKKADRIRLAAAQVKSSLDRHRAGFATLPDSEKIADLQERLSVFEAYFKFGVSEDGLIPWCETQGRFGVMTRWWCKLKWGLGFAFSVGTITDRGAIYGEVEDITCMDEPSCVFFGWLKMRNRKQNNVGVEVHVANQEPGKASIAMLADGNAIQVGSAEAFYIGKSERDAVQLWPKPRT